MKNNLKVFIVLIILITACKREETESFDSSKVDLFVNGEFSIKLNDMVVPEQEYGEYIEFKPYDTLSISFNATFLTNGYPAAIDSLVLSLSGIDGDQIQSVNIDSILQVSRESIVFNKEVNDEYTDNYTIKAIFPDFNFHMQSFKSCYYNMTLYAHVEHELYENDRKELKITNQTNGLIFEPADFYTFKLYNNYVGKPFDSDKGLGYNIFTREYINQACEVERNCNFFDGGSADDITYLLDDYSTIMNLTYVDSVNVSNDFFNPAFGLLNGYTRKNLGFRKANGLYDWDNRIYMGMPHSNDGDDFQRVMKNPEIGDTYLAAYAYYYTWFLLHVIDIVDDGEDSYIEFEVMVNNNSQRRYEYDIKYPFYIN